LLGGRSTLDVTSFFSSWFFTIVFSVDTESLNKKFTHSELRDGNIKTDINKTARSFNSYFISSVYKLISQHFNNENCLLPLREGFSDKFPEIV
jgi:hypothetical protein